jgi:Holliday junction resolvase RusA-like endonuclease
MSEKNAESLRKMQKEIEKQSKIIELEFNQLPKILSNGSHGHWRVAAGIKKLWQNRVINKVTLERLAPPKPWKKSRAIFTRFSSVEPDYDNLVISFKAIRDGLKKAGVIEDDGPKFLDAVYYWDKVPPKFGKVRIEVWEIKEQGETSLSPPVSGLVQI